MLLQVHDELVFEVPESELEQLDKLVKEVMENTVQLDVPLLTDSNWGKIMVRGKINVRLEEIPAFCSVSNECVVFFIEVNTNRLVKFRANYFLRFDRKN